MHTSNKMKLQIFRTFWLFNVMDSFTRICHFRFSYFQFLYSSIQKNCSTLCTDVDFSHCE